MRKEKYSQLTEEQKDVMRKECLVRYYKNRDKIIEYNKNWKKKNKDKTKASKISFNMKNLYNMSIEIYNKMFDEQCGCCAICGRHQSEVKNRLAVDHCHETNIVRDLLCNKCNLALGNFNDNTDMMEKAIKYLNKHKKTIEIISPDQSKIILGK